MNLACRSEEEMGGPGGVSNMGRKVRWAQSPGWGHSDPLARAEHWPWEEVDKSMVQTACPRWDCSDLKYRGVGIWYLGRLAVEAGSVSQGQVVVKK